MHELLTVDQKQKLLWVLAAACLMALLEALGIFSIYIFFSLVSGGGSFNLEKFVPFVHLEGGGSLILIVGICVLFLTVLKNGYAAWNAWYQNTYVSYVRHSLSTRLFSFILNQSYAYFLNKNTEILKARFLTDVDRISDGYLRACIALTSESLVAFSILLVLLIKNFIGTLIVLAALVLVGLIINTVLRRLSVSSSHDLTVSQHKRYFIGGMAMAGIKDVKASCSEQFFSEMFIGASALFSKVHIVQNMILTTPRLVIETIAIGVVIFTLMVVSGRGEGLNGVLPLIAIYAAAAYRMLPSLNRIISSIQQLNFASEPILGIHEMMAGYDSIDLEGSSAAQAMLFEDKVEVVGLSYIYPDSSYPSLSDISFRIRKNEFVGIVGASGAGKSTLIDVLLGLLYPSNGQIKVDGLDLKKENMRGWLKGIGYVPQNINLIDDSLANNIAFGKRVNMDEILRVSELAQLEEFVNSLPESYETKVGENGVRLSGGQRQRIGIARALYGGVDILLLDEATSALDNETEREVTRSILSLSGKVTLIVVAHRLSTVKFADKLLVLDKGHLIADGKFDDLVSSCGVFRRIAQIDDVH